MVPSKTVKLEPPARDLMILVSLLLLPQSEKVVSALDALVAGCSVVQPRALLRG